MRDGPRPTVEEWKETFAFIRRFQLLYAVDPEFPEMLLRAAASHHETKLKTAYRRLNGLIGFSGKHELVVTDGAGRKARRILDVTSGLSSN